MRENSREKRVGKLESEEEKLLTVLINGTHWTSRPAISETTSQSEYWPITIGSRSIGAFLIICLSIEKMEKLKNVIAVITHCCQTQ